MGWTQTGMRKKQPVPMLYRPLASSVVPRSSCLAEHSATCTCTRSASTAWPADVLSAVPGGLQGGRGRSAPRVAGRCPGRRRRRSTPPSAATAAPCCCAAAAAPRCCCAGGMRILCGAEQESAGSTAVSLVDCCLCGNDGGVCSTQQWSLLRGGPAGARPFSLQPLEVAAQRCAHSRFHRSPCTLTAMRASMQCSAALAQAPPARLWPSQLRRGPRRPAAAPAAGSCVSQQPCTCGVVIVDHGSRRAASNEMLLQFCALYQQLTQQPIVEPAHMEIAEPSIAQAVGEAHSSSSWGQRRAAAAAVAARCLRRCRARH